MFKFDSEKIQSLVAWIDQMTLVYPSPSFEERSL
jgi:hypothetical protein